ncbi:MAG: excinuclease ABC subunit UvrB, partial [Rhodospirillaceae bacterium]
YSEMTLSLKAGDRIDRDTLLRRLVELQYRRNDTAFARGAFRVRGDGVEIFPSHMEDRAWRLSLFGDELESIVEFDPLTGHKTDTIQAVKLYANSHYVTPKPTLNQAIEQIKVDLRLRLDQLMKMGRLVEA